MLVGVAIRQEPNVVIENIFFLIYKFFLVYSGSRNRLYNELIVETIQAGAQNISNTAVPKIE
jgi:hypothetical protein